MAKKVESVSKQLQEVSKIVNAFKSEAVQLKVVELLLSDLSSVEPAKKVAAKKVVAKAKPAKKIAAKKVVAKAAPAKKVAAKKVVAKAAPAKKVAAKKVVAKAAPAKKVAAKKVVAKVASKKVAAKKVVAKAAPKKSSSSKSNLPGPSKTVTQLAAEGFFATKKNIAEVLQHCNTALKLPYRVTDLSGILNKLVKDNKLKREKNEATRKFEYINA